MNNVIGDHLKLEALLLQERESRREEEVGFRMHLDRILSALKAPPDLTVEEICKRIGALVVGYEAAAEKLHLLHHEMLDLKAAIGLSAGATFTQVLEQIRTMRGDGMVAKAYTGNAPYIIWNLDPNTPPTICETLEVAVAELPNAGPSGIIFRRRDHKEDADRVSLSHDDRSFLLSVLATDNSMGLGVANLKSLAMQALCCELRRMLPEESKPEKEAMADAPPSPSGFFQLPNPPFWTAKER